MASGLALELLQKHSNSTQQSSQTLCAVLRATLEVLQSEGMEATPSALFAAIMSSLERPQGYSEPQVAMALCTVLSACLGRVPDSLVRSKFVSCSRVVMQVLELQRGQAGVVRAAVTALGQITAAQDPTDWASAMEPFTLLLKLSLDPRPKVRRAAHGAVRDTLAALQALQAAGNACETVLKVCQQILPGPEAALKANGGSNRKQKQESEALLQSAISNALHLLNLLKIVAPLLSGSASSQLGEMMPKLLVLQQPLLSRSALDALNSLCGQSTSLGIKHTARLLSLVLQADTVHELRDSNVQLSFLQLAESCMLRIHEQSDELSAGLLDEVFSRMLPLLTAANEEVRQSAAAAMKNVVHRCLQGSELEEQQLQAFARLEAGLGALHQESWPAVLSVVEELFSGLRPSNARLVTRLLGRVSSLFTSASASASEGDAEAAAVVKAASAAIGAAIRSLGAEDLLSVLPLNLQASDGEQSRLWLLPLLKQHVGHASLDYWGATLMPQARSLIEAASALPATNEARLTGLQYRALEAQIWGTLPSFCNWPTDVAPAFKRHAQSLGKAFENREDLRPPICTALERLCQQSTAALQEEGSFKCSLPAVDDNDDDPREPQDDVPLDIPEHYTKEIASRDAAVLRQFAKNWMPLLFNAFNAAPAGQRAHIGRCISAYAVVADPGLLEGFFKIVVKKLIKVVEDSKVEAPAPDAIKEGGENPSERRCTFMELALCLMPGLSAAAVNVLYKAASPSMQEKDQAVQKRAYKLLAYILEHRRDVLLTHFQEILDSLLLGVASSMSAAKRYRLKCLKAAVLALQGPDAPEVSATDEDMAGLPQSEQRKQVVAMLVSEIVLCIKEVNKRTRVAAYELLVGLANAMHDAEPPPVLLSLDAEMDGGEEEPKGGLHTLFTMILGGLVGASPHMMSASVMALARLLYEFVPQLQGTAPQLLPVVLSLLRSKSREVIKSVLGFVKVCVIKLPAEILQQHVEAIIEGILLWSQDSKNKFRLKVRLIVERLVRRLDYESVADCMPEDDRKLLVHIRKEQARKQRKKGEAEEGTMMDVDTATVAKSRGGKTRGGRSEWAHSQVFSSDDEEEAAANGGRSRASLWGDGPGRSRRNPTSHTPSKKGAAGSNGLRESEEPLDLLDPATSRAMHRSAAGQSKADKEVDFPTEGGKIVVRDEEAVGRETKPKRKRGGGIDHAASDDSDFDDLHKIAGATAALRLGGESQAGSAAAQSGHQLGARSATARSMTGKSFAGRTSAGKTSKSGQQGKEHSGKRFAASKKGAGGDVKGKSKVEPYAYWPLDRKMLNRRTAKKSEATQGLTDIVSTSGNKWKNKKQRR